MLGTDGQYSSCLPNCILMFEGKRASVRALEPISKGSEVQ